MKGGRIDAEDEIELLQSGLAFLFERLVEHSDEDFSLFVIGLISAIDVILNVVVLVQLQEDGDIYGFRLSLAGFAIPVFCRLILFSDNAYRKEHKVFDGSAQNWRHIAALYFIRTFNWVFDTKIGLASETMFLVDITTLFETYISLYVATRRFASTQGPFFRVANASLQMSYLFSAILLFLILRHNVLAKKYQQGLFTIRILPVISTLLVLIEAQRVPSAGVEEPYVPLRFAIIFFVFIIVDALLWFGLLHAEDEAVEAEIEAEEVIDEIEETTEQAKENIARLEKTLSSVLEDTEYAKKESKGQRRREAFKEGVSSTVRWMKTSAKNIDEDVTVIALREKAEEIGQKINEIKRQVSSDDNLLEEVEQEEFWAERRPQIRVLFSTTIHCLAPLVTMGADLLFVDMLQPNEVTSTERFPIIDTLRWVNLPWIFFGSILFTAYVTWKWALPKLCREVFSKVCKC